MLFADMGLFKQSGGGGGGGGAGSFPNMTFSPAAVYETVSPLFGTGSLKGGTGTATITLPSNNLLTIELFVMGTNTDYTPAWMYVQDSGGNVMGVGGQWVGFVPSLTTSTNATSSVSTNYRDGVTHHIAICNNTSNIGGTSANVAMFIDGVCTSVVGGAPFGFVAGAATVYLSPPTANLTVVDSVRISSGCRYPSNTTFTPPAGPLTRDGSTVLGLWQLDTNGTGT